MAGEVGAKTGLVQPPAWAWSCPLPAQSARTQKALGGCTQQSQGQGGGTLLGSLLPAPLTISTADFPTFPPWEHLAVCFGSKPDLRASGSAVLGKTPSSSCAPHVRTPCLRPASAPRVCAPPRVPAQRRVRPHRRRARCRAPSLGLGGLLSQAWPYFEQRRFLCHSLHWEQRRNCDGCGKAAAACGAQRIYFFPPRSEPYHQAHGRPGMQRQLRERAGAGSAGGRSAGAGHGSRCPRSAPAGVRSVP